MLEICDHWKKTYRIQMSHFLIDCLFRKRFLKILIFFLSLYWSKNYYDIVRVVLSFNNNLKQEIVSYRFAILWSVMQYLYSEPETDLLLEKTSLIHSNWQPVRSTRELIACELQCWTKIVETKKVDNKHKTDDYLSKDNQHDVNH